MKASDKLIPGDDQEKEEKQNKTEKAENQQKIGKQENTKRFGDDVENSNEEQKIDIPLMFDIDTYSITSAFNASTYACVACETATNNRVYGLHCYADIGGEYVLGMWLECKDLLMDFFYCRVASVTRCHPQTYRRLGMYFAGNYLHMPASLDPFEEYIKHGESVTDRACGRVQMLRGMYKRQKISSDAHTLLRPEEVIAQCCRHAQVVYDGPKIAMAGHTDCDNWRCRAAHVLTHVMAGEAESTVATVLTYVYVASRRAVMFLAGVVHAKPVDTDLWKWLKYWGVATKQAQHVIHSWLNEVFELNVLRNRVDQTVDWAAEEASRTTDAQYAEVDEKFVFEQAKIIFRDGIVQTHEPLQYTWKDYWSQRWAFMPTGSFVSQYEQDKKYKNAFTHAETR